MTREIIMAWNANDPLLGSADSQRSSAGAHIRYQEGGAILVVCFAHIIALVTTRILSVCQTCPFRSMSTPELAAAAEEEKRTEEMAAAQDPQPPPRDAEALQPFQDATAASERLQVLAVTQDMERQYQKLREERDALHQRIESLTAEKEAAEEARANLASLQQTKESLQNQFQQEEIKCKGLEEEKTLLQERMDRMQAEADQLREELR